MFKLAAITLLIAVAWDFSLIHTIAHYRDYVLGGVLALMLQPWVMRQLD